MSSIVLSRGLIDMPLTRPVSFKTVLEKGNRVQVPKMVRWQFKLETDQVQNKKCLIVSGRSSSKRRKHG